MKPLHRLAALLALALVLILGFLLPWTAESEESTFRDSDPRSTNDTEDSSISLRDLTDSKQRSVVAKVPEQLGAPEPATQPEPPTIASDPLPSWILWLDVQGPVHDEEVLVTVRARPDGGPFAGSEKVIANCKLNERSRIALDSLLVEGRTLGALVIEAQHPTVQTQTMGIALPSVGAKGHGPPAAVEATLILKTSTRVVGEARDSKGLPLAARVGIWRFDGEQLNTELLREENTNGSGRFDVEVPGQGSYLIVVANQALQPAWQRFAVNPDDPIHDTGALVLEKGAELEGRFTVGGDTPPYPVSFTLRREVQGVVLHWGWMNIGASPGNVVWTGGRVERHSSDKVANTLGAFHVEGLVPGEYTMHMHGFDQGHGRMNREPKLLSVPSHGLAIELGWSRVAVRLELEDPSVPPRAGTLVLERPRREPERSDFYGGELTGQSEREFVFDADEPLTFQVEIDGLEPIRRELYAPQAGSREEVAFAIPALDRSAKLRLVLSGDLPPEGTFFIVHVASLEHGPARGDLGLIGDRESRTVALSGGNLILEGLAPGPSLVLAYPGKHSGQRASLLLDASAEVNLLSKSEANAHLRFDAGGRLRVGKRNGSGGWSMAPCEILDSGGAAIGTTFVSYAPNGGGGASARGMLPDLAPSEVVPNLTPGTYSVRVGGEERVVEVRAGETTEVIFD